MDADNVAQASLDGMRALEAALEEEKQRGNHCSLSWNEALEKAESALSAERTARRVMRETVCFFASVIKSGEPWTATCQQSLDAALAAESGEAAGGLGVCQHCGKEHGIFCTDTLLHPRAAEVKNEG